MQMYKQSKTARLLSVLFAAAVLLDLIFIVLQGNDWRWFSKTLLMPLLLALFVCTATRKDGALFYLIVAALSLSWAGDVLLQAQNFFIPGLVAFLLAHVCYIAYLRKFSTGDSGLLKRQPVVALPVVVYIGLLLWYLLPHLDALAVPVIIYSLTIGTMLLMAFHTRNGTTGMRPVFL
jgi:uncharacterized membrane protein YhhN